ncbi:MAG TPA: DUF3662 and FHA domain-containing protein [Methylomusa anaerophila]|uniref:ABC transporter ATP-binding/permease protein n=1 Tax=Methylomusa anaerophila TaxID=1930071 RepID=A0A348APN5_9FIRM|nr:DUF3662 and FHA domain-containing protein [Methylomusa anaerophila]BBB93033.1 ABC transporter ATP-binding/permease protein [Methylomusa anaerophila]HML87133.1 DUF3662 and FHA domain-containing protein [Methylomusa anaerophila]
MKFVRNLENFFEKYIEGFFNKYMSSGLQPVEIARELIRRMEDDRMVGVSHIFVPNYYAVYVSAEEYKRIESYLQTVCQELTEYLYAEAGSKGYTFVGNPQVEILVEELLEKHSFSVVTKFTEALPIDNESCSCKVKKSEGKEDTRIFNKFDLPLADFTKKTLLHGVLTVSEGLDTGLSVDITAGRVNIGRRESNELPLSDMNTSRLHAYVIYEDNHHIILDAKSLNGTYVNNHRVYRKTLKDGDRIKVGNTVIVYGVK